MSKKNILGNKLKEVRLAHGISGNKLAFLMGCTQSRVSKVESGRVRPSIEYINDFSKALGLDSVEKEDLLDYTNKFLAEFDKWKQEVNGAKRFPIYERHLEAKEGAEEVIPILQRETDSRLIEYFNFSTVITLLQTQDYTKLLWNFLGFDGSGYIERFSQRPSVRQRVLFDTGNTFRILLGEAALISGAFPSEVMKDQISKIRYIASFPNVEIGFVPLYKSNSIHSSSSFTMYDRKLTVIEGLDQEFPIWTEAENKMYANLFDRLMEVAVPIECLDIVKEYERIYAVA